MFMTLAGGQPETFVRLLADFLQFGDEYLQVPLESKHSDKYASDVLKTAELNPDLTHRLFVGNIEVVFSCDWSSVSVDGGLDYERLKEIVLEGARLNNMIIMQKMVRLSKWSSECSLDG